VYPHRFRGYFGAERVWAGQCPLADRAGISAAATDREDTLSRAFVYLTTRYVLARFRRSGFSGSMPRWIAFSIAICASIMISPCLAASIR
jgi:hypothetical protein